jgi:hypothetical protein
MDHRIVLDLPGNIYEPLATSAERAGTTPERLAVEWIAATGRNAAADPLEQFIGILKSNVPNWPEQHDEHLGNTLAETLEPQSLK